MSHQPHLSPRPRFRSRIGAALAVAAVLITAACGQNAAQQPEPSLSSSSSASLPSRSSVTVTVPGIPSESTSSSSSSSSVPSSEPALTTTVVVEPPVSSVAPPVVPEPAPPATTAPVAPVAPPAQGSGQVAGRVVALDAGHNGGNGANTSIINQPVPDGRGGTKPCNTTGTSTNAGFAEHAFNWSVTNYMKSFLEAEGVQVVMIREDADGVGPCIDKRAQKENDSGAELVVSVHADGYNEGERGFYVILVGPQTEVSAPFEAKSTELATYVRDGLVNGGEQTSSWIGDNGITYRDDLTGLNMSAKPKILVEYGNMRDSQQAAYMGSKEGQQSYARGTVAGILEYLRNN